MENSSTLQSADNAKGNGTVEDENLESLSEFAENSSLHGVRYLGKKSTSRKLFWLGCIMAAAAYCSIQLVESVTFYMKRPYSTVITTKQKQQVEFPAVTICNLNMVSTRKYTQEIKKRFPNITDLEIKTDLYALSTFLSALSDSSSNVTSTPRTLTKQELASAYRFSSIIDSLEKITHQIDDLLLPQELRSCRMMTQDCDKSQFKQYFISQYGKCYTFRPPFSKVSVIGWAAGLRLRLNVEADSYLINSYKPVVGLKVLVHSPEEYPLVEDKGFIVAPGTHTSCSVRRKEVHSLPHPYETNCGEKNLDLLEDSAYKYSRSACVKECWLRTVIQRCKCTINTQIQTQKSGTLPVCVRRDHAACIGSVMGKLGTMTQYLTCQNECQEACNYSEYEYRLSTGRLSEKTLVSDTNVFCARDTKNTQLCQIIRTKTEPEKLQYIRDNVLSVDVFLEDFNYEEIKQVPVYEMFTLISSIGGNLGLFLGMSLLTTAELLDYLARSLWFKLRCKTKRVSASTTNDDKLESLHVSSFDNHEFTTDHVFQPEIYNVKEVT